MTPELPAYLGLKLKTTVARVAEAARTKGLEKALAYELFDLKQQVEEAFVQQDATLAKTALAQEQRLLNRIESLPSKVRAGSIRKQTLSFQRD